MQRCSDVARIVAATVSLAPGLRKVDVNGERGFEVGAHVILGLSGETPDDVHATARELARLEIDSVKLHNLYVSEHTQLARALESGELRLPDRDQYVGYVVDFLQRLHPAFDGYRGVDCFGFACRLRQRNHFGIPLGLRVFGICDFAGERYKYFGSDCTAKIAMPVVDP